MLSTSEIELQNSIPNIQPKNKSHIESKLSDQRVCQCRNPPSQQNRHSDTNRETLLDKQEEKHSNETGRPFQDQANTKIFLRDI